MNPYLELSRNHLPNLYRYVVPLAHEGDGGRESIGSGVMINVRGRHFVATARHCINRNPRVMLGGFSLIDDKITADRAVRIVRREYDATLDIGLLELEAVDHPGLEPQQLSCDRIVDGMVYFVGHPVCMMERDKARREICLTRAAFGTQLEGETEDYLQFAFPHEWFRFDEHLRELETRPFVESPHGFSGGPCFGVSQSSSRTGIPIIEYKLLGIQYAWHEKERWVKAIPIRRWISLLNDRCDNLVQGA